MQMAFELAPLLFTLKKVLAALLLPPLSPLLLVAAGLLVASWRRRLGHALAWCGVLAGVLLATPASVGLMLRALEPATALDLEAARGAQAIVIVGAGRRTHAPEFGGTTVNRLSLERLRYGAVVARATGLPVLVSGGAPRGERAEAELMRDSLEADFAVAVRWLETASRDTRQNAQFSAPLLKAASVQRIVLVTHAAHMARAQAEFERQGLDVVPAPTAWLAGPPRDDEAHLSALPSQNAAYAGWFAVHEWLGGLAYRWSR